MGKARYKETWNPHNANDVVQVEEGRLEVSSIKPTGGKCETT